MNNYILYGYVLWNFSSLIYYTYYGIVLVVKTKNYLTVPDKKSQDDDWTLLDID
jgi:hypothetical protein